MAGTVRFNDRDLKDYQIILISIEHGAATPKTNRVEVPGADGTLDMTGALTDGDVKFNDRTHKYKFETKARPNQWPSIEMSLGNAFNGKQIKIIESRDEAFYWQGRVEVGSISAKGTGGQLEITATVEPYKYTVEDLGGSDLMATNGVIQKSFYGFRKWQPLTIILKQGNITSINSKAVNINKLGTHILDDFVIKEGLNTFIFQTSSNAIIDIQYHGGSL